jgi:hypothetical protein
MEQADEILRDKRFTRAPYVGHKGWVSWRRPASRTGRKCDG